MLPGLATSTSGSNMVVSVFQDPVPSSLMPGMAVQTDVGMEREVAGQMMSTGSQVKWFFTEYLLEFFFSIISSFLLVFSGSSQWKLNWVECSLVGNHTRDLGTKVAKLPHNGFIVFRFLAIWLVTISKPWNVIGCFVFSSSLLLFHWLEKRRRFGAKKIERFVIKKICSTDSQSDCKGRWWFETRCS